MAFGVYHAWSAMFGRRFICTLLVPFLQLLAYHIWLLLLIFPASYACTYFGSWKAFRRRGDWRSVTMIFNISNYFRITDQVTSIYMFGVANTILEVLYLMEGTAHLLTRAVKR